MSGRIELECELRRSRVAMETDPVCGMHIDREEAAGTLEYEGRTYYFCSQACHDAFAANPTEYVS
jgi:Cu+-exporting ATPase